MSDYFGDILDTSDNRMGIDCEKPDKQDKPKLFSLKVKSAPGEGVNLAQGFDMIKGKAGPEFKHKVEFKRKFDSQNAVKVVATNKDFEFDYDFTPEALNKDGMNSNLELEGKYIPGKDSWEGKAEYKVGGIKAGPLTTNLELQFDLEKGQDKPAVTVSNVTTMDEFNFGTKLVVSDLKTLSEAYLVAMYKNTTGHFYLRTNVLDRFFGLGCNVSPKDYFHHSFELQFDAADKPKAGIYGYPLFFRFGGLYHLNNKIKLTAQLNAAEGLIMTNKFEIPISKEIKAAITDQVDLAKIYTSPKDLKYDFGATLELKL